jgi:acyl-coenzyme A thioesterase PaaI-like protein
MTTPDVTNELERFRRGVCGGCEAQGRCWLGLERSVDDRGTAHGMVTYTPAHQGGTGVVHGGWLMATFDEVCGLIPTTAGLMGATASMEVRFRRPVPIGVPLEITAEQASVSAERRVIEARMTPAGGEEVLADCVATFVDLTTEKAIRRDGRMRHLRDQQAPGSQAAPGAG